MQYSCNIQISDLEAVKSDFKQELTIEEAEKVVGGKDNKKKYKFSEVSAVAVSIADYSLAVGSATSILSATIPTSPTLPKPC